MDSKAEPPTTYDTTESMEAPPPSYTETAPSYSTSSAPTSKYFSTQIQLQLSTLTSQISSNRTQKHLLSDAHDEKILTLLTYHIQDFLTSFANSGLYNGTLILVPSSAFGDEKVTPTDYDFRDPEMFDRVVRVSDKEGTGERWFWDDEEMARRLARYLNPKRDPETLRLPPRKEEVKQVEEARASPSKGFWGRKKSVGKRVEKPVPVESVQPSKYAGDAKGEVVESGDKVIMNVKAEEVDFRTENQFGIYGTERGWGIIVQIKVT